MVQELRVQDEWGTQNTRCETLVKKKKAPLSVKTEISLIRDTISRKAFLPRAKNDQC